MWQINDFCGKPSSHLRFLSSYRRKTAPLRASLSRYCELSCQTLKLRHIPANRKHPNKEISETPWRWRRLREGKREAGMEEKKNRDRQREREKVCNVCVCVWAWVGVCWGETTVNYTFTHHITGQLKLEQSCVNRAKTNRLNSLQERERFRPDLATHAPPDRSITPLSSTQLQCHSSAS